MARNHPRPASTGRHRISRRTKLTTGALGLAIAVGALAVYATSGTPQQAGADEADKSFFIDITKVRPNKEEPQARDGASTGTFTVDCGRNEEQHFNPDNFIAQPGIRNGAQHLHDYVGNLSTNADSNNKSLLAAGTTCKNGDQSTYFWPVVRIDTGDENNGGRNQRNQDRNNDQRAQGRNGDQGRNEVKRRDGGQRDRGDNRDNDQNGKNNDNGDRQELPGVNDKNELAGNDGQILRPEVAKITFRGSPAGKVKAMPKFLRILYGDAKPSVNGKANTKASWTCTGLENRITEKYPICPNNSKVERIHDFPSCWDGENTDSDDHRSHIVFPNENGNCKRGFTAVPQLRITLVYDIPRDIQEKGQYKVDSFPEEEHNPLSDHDDFANVMSRDLMDRVVGCVNGGKNCAE
ncbi:DUF1996 domain-containing protein [Amycolatopsis sp. NPDC059021]|uniref:DUF1996 domain-containing protein n=1 Tax=Amycolatopsis sp. NPDC059021 TaxID=3346704 RepID=UPI0036708990